LKVKGAVRPLPETLVADVPPAYVTDRIWSVEEPSGCRPKSKKGLFEIVRLAGARPFPVRLLVAEAAPAPLL
jgi:hypothetical protein